jgi:hypothetical protein
MKDAMEKLSCEESLNNSVLRPKYERMTSMRLNSIPWWLWLVPIVLLFLATERMPYGYYTLTRIIVCGFASCLVFVSREDIVVSRVWSAVFFCIAILFNPIIPIYLSRRTWYGFDVAAAIILASHLVFVRLGWMRAKGS